MRIGVLTSGGDSPGMNAAIRTTVVAGIGRGHTVLGIRRGYAGLLAGDATELTLRGVEGISRFGGTMLGSARSAEFPTDAGQQRAIAAIAKLDLDGLVVIGGNGSLTGAHVLAGARPCQIVGLPASIDNDVGYCGLAIGVDTAVNTIVDACDRISDTARAHRRAFLVEVMGRRCGYLAMRAGIAAEADAILYAEQGRSEDEVLAHLRGVLRRRFGPGSENTRVLFIKAEGVQVATERLASRLQEHLNQDAPGVDLRVTVLGHVVRGGSPTATDRVIAQRLALGAVWALESGAHDEMISWEPPGSVGVATPDPSVRRIALADMIAETARLLDGSSPVTRGRVALLSQVEDLLSG